MNRAQHYAEAERLLDEGDRVVDKISHLAAVREHLIAGDNLGDVGEIQHLTQRMDEYGKQAMGIWAQAQVHATLASVNHGVCSQAAVIDRRPADD